MELVSALSLPLCLQIVAFAILAYLILWSLVDRICKCIEVCHTSKSFEKFIECGGNLDKMNIKVDEKN